MNGKENQTQSAECTGSALALVFKKKRGSPDRTCTFHTILTAVGNENCIQRVLYGPATATATATATAAGAAL